MNRTVTAALLLFIIAAGLGQVSFAQEATLFQKPTVNRTHIVFVYAGDLWIVPREGGDARRLTTGIGEETDLYFSPDGTMIAFTGAYDGNTDVFVIPSGGGVPKRLTYHPGPDRAVGWTNDGKQVFFSSARESYVNIFLRLCIKVSDGGKLMYDGPALEGKAGCRGPSSKSRSLEWMLRSPVGDASSCPE